MKTKSIAIFQGIKNEISEIIRLIGKSHFLILFIIYSMAQWMLFVISGRWHDDWFIFGVSDEATITASWGENRIEAGIFACIEKRIPENLLRGIIFLLFLWVCLCIYIVLLEGLNISKESSLCIAVIYAVFPSNDARVSYNCMIYSLGLMLFASGMVLVVNYQKNKNLRDRILSLIVFLFSFILNSNLSFYAVVVLLILYMERSVTVIKKYIDYLVLPFLFFIIKTFVLGKIAIEKAGISYKPEYNKVTLRGMVESIRIIPVALFNTFTWIYQEAQNCINKAAIIKTGYLAICIFGLLLMIALYILKKMIQVPCIFLPYFTENTSIQELCKIFIAGIVSFAFGIFPYLAVGRGYRHTSGWNGRDSILYAIGLSCLTFFMIRMIFNRFFGKYIFCVFLLSGIIYFNVWYLIYQMDYYSQEAFSYQCVQHPELEDCNNIICAINVENDEFTLEDFVGMNANAEKAFGNQNKVFLHSIPEAVDWSMDEHYREYAVGRGIYHMNDYDISDYDIDALARFGFDISLFECVYVKYLEMFNREKYITFLQQNSYMDVWLSGDEDFYKMYHDEIFY